MKNTIGPQRRSAVLALGASASLLFALVAPSAQAAPTPAPGANANASCAPTAGVTPTSVNIAIFYPRTGPASATFGPAENAARLRFAQENAKGGVNGRKLVLTGYDDQGSPSTQSTMATKAIEQDNQFGIILDTITEAMFPYLKSKNVPVVGFNSVPMGTDRNAFNALGIAHPNYGTTTDFERLKKAGVTKLAVVNQTSPSSVLAGNNMERLQAIGGIPVVMHIGDMPTGTFDATSIALRVKNSGADGLWITGVTEGVLSVAQAIKAQAVSLKGMYGTGVVDPILVAKSNGAFDGIITSTYGNVPLGVPGVPAIRTFVNGMKSVGLNEYAPIAPVAFVEADAMIRGLKAAGKCPTRESFINGLRAVKNYNGAGLIPQVISFAPGIMPNGDPKRCTWYQSVLDGKFVADKAPICGKILDSNTLQVVG